MSRPRIYVAMRLPDEAFARLESVCDVARFEGTGAPSKAELIDGVRNADGLLASPMQGVDAEVFDAAPRLRVVSNHGVGFDNVDLDAATARGVVVCNTPGVLTDAVADLTMALVVALARRLFEAQRFVADGRWQPGVSMPLGTDVRDKTLGIVGYGRIGKAVAQRAQAFGMKSCFHDVLGEAVGDGACAYRELDELLRESDFVSLHVNLTEQAHRFIGARELSLMKRTAYLINTSRGQVVDQDALVEALRGGTIAGAALDVLEREPPAPADPIPQLSNVVVLPHIGSATRETRAAMLDLAIDNLLTALRGETPRCVVNPEALAVRRLD